MTKNDFFDGKLFAIAPEADAFFKCNEEMNIVDEKGQHVGMIASVLPGYFRLKKHPFATTTISFDECKLKEGQS